MKSVVVLGGYGNFGRPIVEALANERDCRVLIAGRDAQKAEHLALKIGGNTQPWVTDCYANAFSEALRRVEAYLVIHTAGPFQSQSYVVPRACIDAQCHYVDLADARAFVCGIRELHQEAERNRVLVVSGASSLPALSSAAVDQLASEFSAIDSIEHAITSGAKPPGVATMNGVLAYAGRCFKQWRDGRWSEAYGWQELTMRRYPRPLGVRLLASCDVPDLELFPDRYPSIRTVTFKAGVAPLSHMLAIGLAAWGVRIGLIETLVPFVPRLHRLALSREQRGSKHSAMHVTVRGLDLRSRSHSRTWTLVAGSDHGPFIPSFAAVALARKILHDEITIRGAVPCVGLLNVDEILAVGRGLDIEVRVSG